MITHRRICWPRPDATCLEGGCTHCNGHPFRSVSDIRAYAEQAGEVPNREGGRSKPATQAFKWGLERSWPNTDKRGRAEPVPAVRGRPRRPR